MAGHILERESEGGSQGLGGREVVAVIRELEAEGLGGLVAGNALGKSILDHHHPDSPLLPSPIGEACWWTTHPASKQRSEGEKVRVGDDLILVSVSSERYLVSAPPPPPQVLHPPTPLPTPWLELTHLLIVGGHWPQGPGTQFPVSIQFLVSFFFFSFFLSFFLFFFIFLGPNPHHMGVPRLGFKSEL